MSATVPAGRFVWFDLSANDIPAAIAFYTKVIGWGTDVWKGPIEGMPPYTMFTNNGAPFGGVMPLADEAKKMGAPPHWLGYISTPNVDETTTKATSLGARVYVPPTDIPSVGRFSVVSDPQGAVVAFFTPASQAPGHDGMANLGEVSWHELSTSDWQAAWSFYESLFGWQKMEAMDMGPMGTYQMFGRAGTVLGGMMNLPPGAPQPPAWLFYTRVADLGAAMERTKANGGQIIMGPQEVPGGDTICICLDPQGAAFALHCTKQ